MELSTPDNINTGEGSGGTKPARWRWVLAVAAIAGVATVGVVAQSDQEPSAEVPVSDGSFEVAEQARISALRGVVTPMNR